MLIDNLHHLVQDDPQLTVRILTALARHRPNVFTEALLKLAGNIQLTVNSLEVVYSISIIVVIDQSFLDAYVAKWFHACTDLDVAPKKRNINLICKLLTELIKRNIFDMTKRLELWVHYCNYFSSFGFHKDLKDLILRNSK